MKSCNQIIAAGEKNCCCAEPMTNVPLNGELYNKKEARVSQLMLMRAASQGKKKKKAHFKHYTFIFLYFGRKGLKISNLELAQCCIHLENNCRFRAQIQRLEICSGSVVEQLSHLFLQVNCEYKQECSK